MAGQQSAEALAQASAVIWTTALLQPDPVRSISDAQEFATDLIARLMLHAGPGEHLVTCVTKRVRDEAGLYASLPISCTEQTAEIPDSTAEQAFGALLMLGCLAREAVGLLMRSCADEHHDAPGHRSVVRGWVVQDGYARPLNQAAIRAVAGGGAGPGTGTAPHPEIGVRYETAYSLYPMEEDD